MKLNFTKKDTQEGYLILVSPEYGIVKGPDLGKALMEPKADGMLKKLLLYIGSKEKIVPVSGFRSHAEQIQIWDDTMAKEGEEFTRKYVAKPGHSEHESGLAIDLAENREEIDFICPKFPREGICQTFRKEAARYGFTERYPAGKEQITGIGAEPWHFRYVGYPHAMVMQEKEFTLEEYLAFLQENASMERPYLFGEEDVQISIAYADMREKEEIGLELPDGMHYQASGTNEGGIVLCWCKRLPWQWADEQQEEKP